MKTSSKKLSDTKVEVKVILDAEDLKAAEQIALERMSKEVKTPGFRKGKVPVDVAKRLLNPNDVATQTIDIAVRRTVPEAFTQEKQTVIMIPQVEVTKYVPGESAEYTAVSEVLPDIKLGDFKKLKAKKEERKVTKKDIDEVVEGIAKDSAEKVAVKRKAKLGDEVLIDFEGKIDGEPFEGGAAKDFHLTLGSGAFIPGFEDGIVGYEPGDKFDINVTFPKDYHVGDKAGKKAVFSILIKQLNEIRMPEINDEFAKKCGPFKTVEELRKDIEKNLSAQNARIAENNYKDALVEELVKKSKVTAPEVMINDQLRLIKDDITRNAQSRGMSFDDYLVRTGQKPEDWEKEARDVAERRVKASLVLQILARDNQIEASEDEVENQMSQLREIYGKSKEFLASMKDPRVRQDIKNRITIDKTLDFLVKAQG